MHRHDNCALSLPIWGDIVIVCLLSLEVRVSNISKLHGTVWPGGSKWRGLTPASSGTIVVKHIVESKYLVLFCVLLFVAHIVFCLSLR